MVGEYLFTDEKFIKNLTTNKNLFKKVYDEIKYLVKVATAGSAEKKQLLKVQRAFEKAFETSRTEEKATKNTTKNSGTKYSLGDKADNTDRQGSELKITADMTEEERYEALKKRSINNVLLSKELPNSIVKKIPEISSWDDLNQYSGTVKKKLIRKLAKEFNVIGKEYLNKDINLSFEFSRNNFDETYDKQKHNYVEFAKMFSVFDGVIESAVGIEVHNRTDYKPDPTLDNVFVLISAYQDGDFVVPVKLEVKQFKDKQNTLYVAISLEKIKKTEVFGQGNTETGVTQSPRSVDISIAQIFAKINPSDKNFLKYIPDRFLDGKQKAAKQEALVEDTDNAYMSAVKRNDMQAVQRMVDEAAHNEGYTVKAYHGTSRGDRVGNVFLPERATSGPMAFFTDNREIAEGYAKGKQDTSMAYDPDFDRYETQFRIKTKYNDIPLYRAWGYLPFDARNRITKKAGQLRENWDGDGELILDPTTNEAGGGFQWQLKEARGNTIQALTEQWLNSGNLFNEESRFLEVLEMAGVTEEFKKIGMDSLYFKDPHARHEKVYDTFLKINDPFDTSVVDEKFVTEFETWYEEQDQSQYKRESVRADLWDKNSIDAYEFAERLRDDIEKGTFHAWTSIPDSATDYLKHLGYDGIKDLGGKKGGEGHTVWIPFSSEQVKSADPVTYDDNGEVIPLSERFKADNSDIRYSLSEIVAEDGTSYGIGVKLDSTLLDNLEPKDRISLVKEYVRELQGKVFTAFDEDGEPVDISIAEGNKRFRNSNGNRVATNKDLTTKHISKETKQEAIALIDELISTASYQGSEAARHPHDWLDNDGNNEWDKWTTYIQDKNNTIWEATLHIANTTNGEKILYDISLIKKAEQSGKSDTSLLTLGQSGESDTIPDINSIAQLTENVKGDAKFSLSDTEDIAPVDNIVDNVDIAPIANKYSDIDGLYTCIQNLKNY